MSDERYCDDPNCPDCPVILAPPPNRRSSIKGGRLLPIPQPPEVSE